MTDLQSGLLKREQSLADYGVAYVYNGPSGIEVLDPAKIAVHYAAVPVATANLMVTENELSILYRMTDDRVMWYRAAIPD